MNLDATEKKYVKIYFILLVLFAISMIGPELGIKTVTLITAFGIAFVKAFLVIKHFMYLTIEKKIVHYLLGAMLLSMVLFVAGIAADTILPGGHNWIRIEQNFNLK